MIRYGLEAKDPLSLERLLIQHGGYYDCEGKRYGEGLEHHMREFMTLCWPDEDHHRWSDLILHHYCRERNVIVSGPKDCGKSHSWARIALVDYWCFPEETIWLISSTTMDMLDLRVWSDIKDLFNRARERFEFLPGNILESKRGIFTDKVDPRTGVARDVRKGIILIPCIAGNGTWVGISNNMVGIKQKRRRLLADELSLMKQGYLTSIEHMDKGDFKLCGSGNPIGQGDPQDKLSEPEKGWGTEPQTEKTEVWRNKWGGITIALDGRDSPNNDLPKNRYSYMLNSGDIERTERRWGKDSATVWTQVYGKRKVGLNAHRVLTFQLCEANGAFQKCVWDGSPTTKIYALDAAFGGDRAPGGYIEFGRNVEGHSVLKVVPPHVIEVKADLDPEAQLAQGVKDDITWNGIPAENVFFDAGMHATLGITLARAIGPAVNAVNFGGKASSRPVSADEFVLDRETGQKRLKRCDEQYVNFVCELWWSVRLVVMGRQMRELPKEVADEFYQREWANAPGDRYVLETKPEMKERIGFSPDLADWLAIAVEGARQRGFVIESLRDADTGGQTESSIDAWLEREVEKYRHEKKKRQLVWTS